MSWQRKVSSENKRLEQDGAQDDSPAIGGKMNLASRVTLKKQHTTMAKRLSENIVGKDSLA